MNKRFERLGRIMNLPVSYALLHSRNLLSRKFFPLKKIKLDDELVRNEVFTEPMFPTSLFRSWMTGSRESADKLCGHYFDLLGSGPKHLGNQINWQWDFVNNYDFPLIESKNIVYDNDGGKDIKIPWELSRFQFLPTLIKAYENFHDEKYAIEAKELIRQWILKNPLAIGANWKCTMEVAIRACNFALAWNFLKNTDSWKEENFKREFLTSIVEHGKFIYRNLEYGAGFNGNHLLSDLTGLLFLGILFPQIVESRKWKAKAMKDLETEMRNQIYADGVDFEASIAYHRLVCELFGYSVLIGGLNLMRFSDAFRRKLELMFEFVWYYTKPNGLAPNIGDSDDGRLFIFEDYFAWKKNEHSHLFRLAYQLFPLNKKFIQNDEKTSAGFTNGGIYIMRKNNFYCIVDAGKNGQNGNGGHAHNDTLSFELAYGEDFIIDPGTYTYTANPVERIKFRGTRMHNTVTIDGEEMNRFRNDTLFGIHDDAKPKVNKWQSDTQIDVLDVQHDGYMRLKKPIIHRRIFEFNKNNFSLTITDHLIPKRKSANADAFALEWNFHFASGVNLERKGTQILAESNGVKIEIQIPQELAQQAEISICEFSPSYGVKYDSAVLRIKYKTLVNGNYKFTFKQL
ncbi:alginate lyase family protein [Candidatus Peregrinibacteria bacterium]|nr:alginate lyase family protein [Candidatus Peregrinibacteria bacterium]